MTGIRCLSRDYERRSGVNERSSGFKEAVVGVQAEHGSGDDQRRIVYRDSSLSFYGNLLSETGTVAPQFAHNRSPH